MNRRDSALLYAVVVLSAVFVGALTRPGQALAVVGLAAVVGVVVRELLGLEGSDVLSLSMDIDRVSLTLVDDVSQRRIDVTVPVAPDEVIR